MLRNGKCCDVRSDNVAFCTKDFVNTNETIESPVKLEDINSSGLLENIPPTYARAVQHYQRTLSMTKGMAHQDLDQLYKKFVQTESEAQVSLNALASCAFKTQSPTPLQRHATFLHLVSDNTRFVPTRDVRGSDLWNLRSIEECQKITNIIESIRKRDVSYTGFLTRMKALIGFYNSHADPVLGTFSQTALDMAPQVTSTLTESDKVFVNFIADWIKSPKVIVDSPYEVFVPTILKALRCYNELFFDRSLAIRFLKEVGMFRPWDNIGLIEDATVAGEFIWSKEAKENERKMSEFTTAFLTGDNRDINTDKYESIRHDFGDLPVYTIDDPSAKEIDDGVSIEHVPGDNSAWLHVHIADPTTYISPTHELAQLMQQKVQTLYLPECHFPMLPEELSSKKFSLGSTAHTNSNGSQYALTFSTRINKNGDLVDYKVRPSFVKNVVKIYYDDLDQLLKPLVNTVTDPLVNLTKTFCQPSRNAFALKDQQKETRASTVLEHAKADLLNIHRMAEKHAAKRIANGAILFSRPSPVLEILPEPLALPAIQFTKPNYASHLPAVRLTLDRSGYSPARQMVAETMIMGGRVASKFAKENDVPIPFRTQQWNPKVSTADLRLREEMMKSRDPATGMIKMQDMVNYMSILPPSTMSTDPGLPHVVMGIQDGYTRATSPLRRYLDVVVHWQLKSRLLGEKQTPFSKDQLTHLAARVTTREKQLSLLQQRSIQFWVISLLDRMRMDGFTDNMEWDCIIGMPNRIAITELGGTMEVATGTLLDLGVRGRIEKLNRNVEVGEVVKVRVSSLDPLLGRINLELI